MAYSTDLITRLATSSDGPSHHFFETPSASATVWRTLAPIGDLSVSRFSAQVTSDHYEMSFSSLSGEVDSIKRMLGCTLLSLLPEPVLDDALHTIQEQYSFYSEDLSLEAREQTVMISEGYAVGVGDEADVSSHW